MSKFLPNPKLDEELAGSAGVLEVLDEAAKRAEAAAKQIASSFAATGDYEASLHADGHRLVTTDPAGHIIEWGSVNNPPHGTLKKAAEAVGARFVDDG